MKKINLIITIIFISTFTLNVFAQFDLDLEKKVTNKVNREINKATDDAIDETAETIKSGGKDDEKNTEETKSTNTESNDTPETTVETTSENTTTTNVIESDMVIWTNYDFVAGEKIIFEDLLVGEENGEFPSRWDLLSGSAEVASLNGENVIHFSNSNSIVFPLMDKKDFLPEVFTIEFDVFFEDGGAKWSDIYKIRFYEGIGNSARIDGKNVSPIEIGWNHVTMGQFGGKTKSYVDEKKNWQPKWKHIAIAFNKRSLKVYMNEERMLNIPNLGYKPKMFSIGGHYDDRNINMSSIKNIRINEGGKKLYDRIVAEGKIVTHGILFDVNKSTIKNESMGTINEIVKLMKEHPELNFRIDGYTDGEGEESYNQKLSEERAAAVQSLLIQSGINASRLESKGYGETDPIDTNSTPEGRANNRRVEFVKI